MTAIIIPAHNEAAVIGQTLQGLLRQVGEAGARSTVRAPASLAWLVKIKTRSRLGGMELAVKSPGLLSNEVKDYSGALRGVIANPLKWPKVLVYLYVNLVSRFLARRRFKDLSGYRWEKDLSSRS